MFIFPARVVIWTHYAGNMNRVRLILDIFIRSENIRGQSLKSSEIAANLAPKIFWEGRPLNCWTWIINLNTIATTWQNFTAIGQKPRRSRVEKEDKRFGRHKKLGSTQILCGRPPSCAHTSLFTLNLKKYFYIASAYAYVYMRNINYFFQVFRLQQAWSCTFGAENWQTGYWCDMERSH